MTQPMKPILALFVLAFAVHAIADQGSDPVDETIDQIYAELAELDQHAWAGRYDDGDGLSMVSLWIAPASGAVFQSFGCLHHDLYRGDVESRDGSIFIDWNWMKSESDEPFVAGREYVPLRWGHTTLIVPLGQLHPLLLASRPYAANPVPTYARIPKLTNDQLPWTNGPQLPTKYQHLLELPAISAKIVSVGVAERTRQSRYFHSLAQELQINVGSDDGVFVGMRFELAKRGLSHQIITITNVTPNGATGTMDCKMRVGKRLAAAKRKWPVQSAAWR